MNGTKTKDANKEERITSHNSIADNIANEVKNVLDRHVSERETTEVKKYAYRHKKIINADIYEFSISYREKSYREKDSVSVANNFGILHVAIYRNNSIQVGVSFDYESIPLRYGYVIFNYYLNRTNSLSALERLVGDLGETIKEMNVFKTAKRYQIDISTYDKWGNHMKEGSFYDSYVAVRRIF